MIKKVKVSDLRPKMYIHDLNCAWMDHPFLRNRFLLESDRDIEKLISHGIRDVYIDTGRGLDVADAPTAAEVHQDLENQLQDIGQSFKRLAPKRVTLQEELSQAKTVYREANAIVRATLQDCRLGKQVEVERLEPLVSAITESIFRNPDALASLIRIKRADKYTFQHSVAVGTLLISFCRSLEADRSLVEKAGMGGLLHDIGKMKIPLDILNKPGKLSESEFEVMKKHVHYGDLMLKDAKVVSPVASCIAAEHHERYDGSGYPLGTKGDQISQYGQMASIVDVYDALTSNRIYHVGSEPTEVLKKLLEWSDHHFNLNLVHRFIRTIGIYPVGTLVKLESGYLAVVIEQHHEDLLHPLVRAVFNIRTRCYIRPRDFDLSRPGSSDRIVSFEIPALWRIDPGCHL
ncbi:MAG: HD-GYP domain-containing protein [Methylomonas sp.]